MEYRSWAEFTEMPSIASGLIAPPRAQLDCRHMDRGACGGCWTNLVLNLRGLELHMQAGCGMCFDLGRQSEAAARACRGALLMGDPLDELLQAELDALTEFINSRLAKSANGRLGRDARRSTHRHGRLLDGLHRGEAEPEKIERMSKLRLLASRRAR